MKQKSKPHCTCRLTKLDLVNVFLMGLTAGIWFSIALMNMG